jgi:hypothetical protein
MKEDILEQLVDDFLQSKGYFTKKNIKFKPDWKHPDFQSNKDSNHSDIDVIGYNPLITGVDRVWAVSCKSWQSGFNPSSIIRKIEGNKNFSGREAWKPFRELVEPKWSQAFLAEVKRLTGTDKFTYVMAVTQLTGDRTVWETYSKFTQSLGGNPIKLITLKEMVEGILPNLNTTLASSDLGRTLQLLKTAECLDTTLSK